MNEKKFDSRNNNDVDIARASSEPESPNRLRERIASMTVATLIGFGAIACSPEMSEAERTEITLIEQIRSGDAEARVSDTAYLLHEGVAIRENPRIERGSREDRGNIYERVGEGRWFFGGSDSAYVIRRGIIVEDGSSEWLAFTFPDEEVAEEKTIGDGARESTKNPQEDILNNPELPEDVRGSGTTRSYVTATEYADDLKWVLLSEIRDQTNDDGEPFIEEVSFFDDSDTTLEVAEDGTFYGLSPKGEYVNVGQIVEVDPRTVDRLN